MGYFTWTNAQKCLPLWIKYNVCSYFQLCLAQQNLDVDLAVVILTFVTSILDYCSALLSKVYGKPCIDFNGFWIILITDGACGI